MQKSVFYLCSSFNASFLFQGITVKKKKKSLISILNQIFHLVALVIFLSFWKISTNL